MPKGFEPAVKKWRACLRCDKKIKTCENYRLCINCREHINMDNADGGINVVKMGDK